MIKYKKALKKAKKRKKSKKFPNLSEYIFYKIYQEIKEILKNISFNDIQTPPEHIKADLTLTSNPEEVKKAVEKINSGDFNYLEKAEGEGPFLNIFIKKDVVFHNTLKNVNELNNNFGFSNINLDKFAIIEYSSPNVARPIGVGHLRSTIIGQVLSNIYEATGYIVLRDNYLGDWGTQFGKLIYAYETWGNNKKKLSASKSDFIRELKKLYIRFQKEAENNEEIVEEARSILKKLEEGDGKKIKLWKKFRKLSIEDFEKAYQKLGVYFDNYGGESFFIKPAKNIPDECLEKGFCKKGKEDEVIVEIENFPTFLLRKSDGSTIYHSRDLAQLKFRINKLNPDDILYVVGSEQSLYFKQLFGLAKKLDFVNDTKLEHIGFGLVLGENGKRMSTRHGTAVELESLVNKSIERSRKVIEEKNPNLSNKEKEEISFKIGVGAIIYNDISQSREKNISFDWDRMLNFEAGSAVYLQYTCARINSIIDKYKNSFGSFSNPKKFIFEEGLEFEIVKKIMLFPKIINTAKENNSPHTIAVYLEELASLFNTFYNKISIVKTEKKDLRISRLMLAKGVGLVIKKGLDVLNVPVPKKM